MLTSRLRGPICARYPTDSVMRIISEGEVMASYPDDVPFPSALMLGYEAEEPVHVVVARDPDTGLCHVVTVRERSIRHGHPSMLHLWWARRPPAAALQPVAESVWDIPCQEAA